MKFLYAMHEDLLKKYADTKTQIIEARNSMDAEQIEVAKAEIMQECQVNDFNPAEPEQLFSLNDGIATIPIAGMLVQKVDICAAFFGETLTTYAFIREATAQAENDPRVEKIVYDINSGGGGVGELDQTAQAIRATQKPTLSIVRDMAASAAYWLATSTDEIVSVAKTGFIGSIGVAVEVISREKADDSRGIKRVVLTNTTSKEKRPNIVTEEGQTVIVDELDAVFDVFVESILDKRGEIITRADIEEMGGRVFIASAALERGLIDKVMTVEDSAKYVVSYDGISATSVSGGNFNEEDSMNLTEVFEKNPEAKAEHDKAIDAAKAEGVKETEASERERSAKMLKLAGLPEATKAVQDAIISGMAVEDFAIAEADNRAAEKEAAKPQKMGGIEPKGQVPEKPEGEEESKAVKAVDAAVDVIVGKKEAK